MANIKEILEKYNNFKDAQIRSVENISDNSKALTIVTMDDDGQDLDSVKLTFTNITKSRILEGHVLPFLDMMLGVSIIEEKGLYGFALGNDTSMIHVHLAPMYIVASDLEIKEN